MPVLMKGVRVYNSGIGHPFTSDLKNLDMWVPGLHFMKATTFDNNQELLDSHYHFRIGVEYRVIKKTFSDSTLEQDLMIFALLDLDNSDSNLISLVLKNTEVDAVMKYLTKYKYELRVGNATV